MPNVGLPETRVSLSSDLEKCTFNQTQDEAISFTEGLPDRRSRVTIDSRPAHQHPLTAQPRALSNTSTVRVWALNSTPTKWIGSPRWRYLAA